MTSVSAPSVLAAGYAPLDIVSYRDRMWHAAGGTAGNVAAILGFLGWESSLVAELGDDAAGARVRRDLKKANVSVDMVRLVRGVSTARVVHEITSAGHRYVFRCPACGQRFPTSRPLPTDRAHEVIGMKLAPDVFLFDRVNAGTVALAEHFAETGSFVVFEPSRPARRDLMKRALSAAHVIKQSDDRDAGLDDDDVAQGQVWIVTGGARGARYRIGTGTWHRSQAFPYPVVDAGGAGDWTTAGLVHALPLAQCCTLSAVGDALRWAQALAAVSCGAPGARGLARQHSAGAVLQAARFLEQRGEHHPHTESLANWFASSVPDACCKWCLLPSSVGVTSQTTNAPAKIRRPPTRRREAGERGH